jgi:hypothetical protein
MEHVLKSLEFSLASHLSTKLCDMQVFLNMIKKGTLINIWYSNHSEEIISMLQHFFANDFTLKRILIETEHFANLVYIVDTPTLTKSAKIYE